MSSYKRKEVMDYLTRKPVTTEDIELARTRIQTPVTPLSMQATSNEELGTREGFKDGTFATGFEHGNFEPLTKKQREIAKKVYGLKESEVDAWQTDRANRKKKASIVSGETTLETKYVSKNYDPNRIIVQSPRATDEVTNVIFPNKQIEKSFKKDVKERFTVPQGQSEKNLEYFSKNYPLSKRQAFKAVDYIKNEMGLEYPEGSVKADIEKNKRGLLQSTSEPSVESYVRQKIKQPILEKQNLIRKIDLAHRISKEHMKYLGLQFDTRTTGFDSRLINQVIIRPSEIILDRLYKKQRNVMDAIKEKGLTDELSKQLKDINDKVRIEAKKTNGRLIGVTIDPETLDPYFEGKKAKLGLTNKILDIKEIGEMPIEKRVKFLTNQIVPRIQTEIDKGFTPNDFKEILSDPEKQKSIIKQAEKNAPDTVKELKEIFKNPTSTKSLKLYTDPTGIGNFLETTAGQNLSKSAPNLLKTTAKLSAVTGTPINALLGVALYSDEFKEKGLGDLETIAAGAYKGSTQDLLNFGDLIFRKLPVATYEKFVEDKPFLESLLNKPEYFEFADKQIDKYTSEKSLRDRVRNRAEYEVRKSFPPTISETDVPVTATTEEYENLIKAKENEILNQDVNLKKAYEEENIIQKEIKPVAPKKPLFLGPIVITPDYTQEEKKVVYNQKENNTEEPKDNLYIPPLAKKDPSIREGVLNLAFGGRVNFAGGGIKLARLISDVLLDLKNSIHIVGNTARFQGIQKAKLEALTPYRNIPDQSKHTTILESINKARQNLPKEYHSILDDIKKDVDNFDYATADNRIMALDKTVAPELRFESLSKDLFPMEDPLNKSFIIMDPNRDNMTSRYVMRVGMDPETGRGIRQTFDTFDSESRKFLNEKDWKLIGVESLEKGKEGLN